MTEQARLDRAHREQTLATILAKHPTAGLAAIEHGGAIVPMPATVPLTDHVVLEGTVANDLIARRDGAAVLRAWERARKRGAGHAPVHARGGTAVTIQFLDVRELHGVWIVILVPDGGDPDTVEELVDSPPLPPRFCWMKRDQLSTVLEMSESATEILGWAPEELIGRPEPLSFVHPDDQGRVFDNWIDTVFANGKGCRVRARFRCRDGSWRWIEFTNYSFLNDPDDPHVRSELVDISDEMAGHEALRAREQLLDRLAEALPHGVIQVDEHRRIVYTNNRLEAILGPDRATTLDEKLNAIVPEDLDSLERAIEAVLGQGLDQDIEVRIAVPDRPQLRVCGLTFRALTSAEDRVSGAVICVSDITESTLMRAELEVRATFDPLTHALNRASIMSVLDTTLAGARQPGSGTAVLFIDLDRFKEINDRLGHPAGDALLSTIARRLQDAVRTNDIVGRIGGDEFLIVCPEIDSCEVATVVADRIAEQVRQPVMLEGETVDPQASIGVAWTRNDQADGNTLVALADEAMYRSKRDGAGRPVLKTEPLVSSSPRALVRTDARS